MKNRIIIAYMSIPAIFALVVGMYAMTKRGFSTESFVSYIIGGMLFYAAPYLLWGYIALTGKFSKPVIHAGFIGATIALVYIASLWLLPPDPSGLPIQWMAYWPLALILQIVVASIVGIIRRNKSA